MSMLLAGKLAGAGLKYGVDKYNQSKMPDFAKSNMGQYYAKIKSQGMYSPKGITDQSNQFANTLNRQGADAKSDYQGALMKKFGGVGSIAGVSAKKDIDLKNANSVADYKAKLTKENEMSKVDAGQKLAQGKYDQKMAKYEMGNQARSNFVNSLSGIATDSLTQRSDLMKDPSLKGIYDSLDINPDDPSGTDIAPLVNKLTMDGKSQEEILAYLEVLGLIEPS